MFVNFSCNFLYLYMKTYNYIYLITNNLNGKIYVGKHSTDNLNDGYMGSGVALHRAYNKYGQEHFTKKILAYADTEEKLNWFERFYIKKYHARTKGYNLTDGGDGVLGLRRDAWNKGVPCSEDQKHKISLKLKGKPMSEETKLKLSLKLKGKKQKTRSEETKKKISETKKGKTPWNKGKTMSEEQKRKISESLKRKKEAV